MDDRKKTEKIDIDMEDLQEDNSNKNKIDIDFTSNNRTAKNMKPASSEPHYSRHVAFKNESHDFIRREGNVDYPKADYGKRILASLIDLAIAYIPGTVYSLIIFPIAFSAAFSAQAYTFANLLSIGHILFWGLGAIYFFIKDGLGLGQSIGKKMQQLMVVRLEDNRPCTMGTSFIRSFILYFLLPIEIIISLAFNDKGHRLGDMAVKTQVIDSEIYR